MVDDEKRDDRSLGQKLMPLKPWWRNFLFSSWQTTVLFLFCVVIGLAFLHDTGSYRAVASNPCAFCPLVNSSLGGYEQPVIRDGVAYRSNVTFNISSDPGVVGS